MLLVLGINAVESFSSDVSRFSTGSPTDQADRRYAFRVDGKLERISAEQFAPPANDDIVRMVREAFSSSIITENSVNEGTHGFDQHLIQLIRSKTVTPEAARYYAIDWNRLDMKMHGYASSRPGILKPDLER